VLMGDVFTAGTVAALAADIPLRGLLGVDVKLGFIPVCSAFANTSSALLRNGLLKK
jgi:hypothetical protein